MIYIFGCMLASTLVGSSYILFTIIYPSIVHSLDSNSATIGIAGSLHIASGNLLAFVTGALIQNFGCRKCCSFGCLVASLSIIASAFTDNFYLFAILYGLLTGFGLGAMLMSGIISIQQNLPNSRHRSLAASLGILGFSVGGVFAGPIAQVAVDNYHWRGALVLWGAWLLNGLPIAMTFEKRNVDKVDLVSDPHRPPPCIELFRLFDRPLGLYLCACFCAHIGVNAFMQHGPSRAISLGFSPTVVSSWPSAVGISSGISRLVFGAVADRYGAGKFRLLQFSFAVLAAGCLHTCTPLVKDWIGVYALSMAQSCFSGAFFCLLSVILVDLKGIENIPKTQSILSFVVGVAVLISTPLAGFLYDITEDYNLAYYVTGSIYSVGGVIGLTSLMFL